MWLVLAVLWEVGCWKRTLRGDVLLVLLRRGLLVLLRRGGGVALFDLVAAGQPVFVRRAVAAVLEGGM